MAVIRPLKTGGYSVCRASEENIGKRRCQHIGGSNVQSFPVQKTQGLETINVEEVKNKKEKDIRSYFNKLTNALSDKDRNLILSELRSV